MEVLSFSFLNQEDYSNFYTFFQESDDNNSGNKRRRTEDEEAPAKETLKDVLATLLLLDEQEKSDQENWALDSENHKSLMEANYNQESRAMSEYYDQFQGFYSNLNETEHTRTKRARQEANTVVANAIATEPEVPESSAQLGGGSGGGQHRWLWVKNRSKAWWEQCNHPDFPEEEFRRAFRMSRATFDMICDELDLVVTKKDTMLRLAILVRQRVAVCIWRLATGEPLRLVSKRFGLGISTCHKLVLEVCSAIKTVLMPKFLQWPDEGKLKEIKDEFELISGIPNVGGSVYTTHVPIMSREDPDPGGGLRIGHFGFGTFGEGKEAEFAGKKKFPFSETTPFH